MKYNKLRTVNEKPKKPRKPHYQINKTKCLSDNELKELNRRLKVYLKEEPSRFLPVLIAIETGARRSEILKLKVKNVDFENKTVLIEATKGSNDREIPLRPSVMTLLRKHIAPLKSRDRLFKISAPTIFRVWSEIRPVDKGFHSLRHTFAIQLFKKRRDLRLVQVALGHRDIQSTMVYAQYVYQTEELRKLIVGYSKSS